MQIEEDFMNKLDYLAKSRSERKKEEYLKFMKDKKKLKKLKKKGNDNHLNLYQTKSNEKEDSQLNLNDDSELQKLIEEEKIEIEYVDEETVNKPKLYENFKNVFEYFVIPKKEKLEDKEEEDHEDEDIEDENQDNIDGYPINNLAGQTKLSKKKRKLLKQLKISELKQITDRPEVVEAWDVTAQDPILLVSLKSMRNTISVPKHWSQKRKFLQNKRGVLKNPFKLPDYIEATGISKIRDNTGEQKRVLKQKMRERMQPKLGRKDIDYQVLHDAFFRYQTKPQLSIHGDIYYENKEYEKKMKFFMPGRISDKLRVALGIPENNPPPFIVNMQRYGPPPAYPNLKIPGVNAPLLDPTADITPNLWTPPTRIEKPILVYDFSTHKINHWGDLREIDEDELSEELNEDLSVSDEGERPQVDNLFSGMDMNLNDETKLKMNLKSIESEKEINLESAVPNPNANVIFPNLLSQDQSFFTVLEQKEKNINIGKEKGKEIFASTFGYVMPGKEENIGKIDEEEIKKIQTENIEVSKTSDAIITTTGTVTIQKKKEKKITNFKF